MKSLCFLYGRKSFFSFFFLQRKRNERISARQPISEMKGPNEIRSLRCWYLFDTLCLYREIVRIVVKFGWIFASNENWKIVQPFSFSSRRGNGLASVCVLHKYIDDNWNFLFLINVCFNSAGFALSFLLLTFIEEL